MKWGKIAGIVLVVLVLIIGGGAAYLASLDVDEYRGEIAQAAQDATGRVLKLEGPLSLAVSLSPTVSGEGISLANASWGTRPQMLTLRRFEVELQLFPLLFGDMQINRLILVEPDIFLETDAKGVGNWLFEVPGEKSKQAESGGGDAAIPHVGRLRIENGLLTYRDGASGETTKIALTSVEATADSPSDPLQLSVIAALNENAVKLTGSVGPLKNAMDPDAPLQIDLAAEGFGVNATVKGTATAARGALDALVKVSATDLSGLRPLAGNGVPAGLPLNLGAQAKANDGKASLTNIKLTLGKSDLAGTASFDATGEVPVLTADFSGKRLDLSQIQAASKDTATKKTSAASKSKRPGKVLPADKLPLDDLKSINADVKLSLAEVITPQITLNQVSATAKLSKGHLAVQPMGLTLAGSKVDMAASVDAGRKRPAVTFSMTAPKLDVGRLLTESKTTDLVQGTGSLKVKLSGQGHSVAAIAGSLNGGTSLLMNEGKVKTEALDMAVGGLSAIVGMMSSEKSEWTVLNCVASRFDIKKGVATSKVLLADTEYSTIVGEGSLDLGKEALAMKVSPQSKSVTLNVAVPIKIGGTFAEPTFRPDELATARRLGGLLGAALFPPAALLALGDMGSGDDNPCLKIAKGGGKKPAAQTSEQPAASKAEEAVKSPLDAVKKGLGSLFNKKE